MKHTLRHGLSAPLLVAAMALMGAIGLRASTASAQFRLGAYTGVEGIRHGSFSGFVRGEATISLIPWLHIGGYAAAVHGFDQSNTGPSYGGLVAFRPAIPFTRWDPMAFASVGWQRSPTGSGFDSGGIMHLGGGLVYHAFSVLDLEFRGAFVQMLGSDRNGTGFQAGLGLSLHP